MERISGSGEGLSLLLEEEIEEKGIDRCCLGNRRTYWSAAYIATGMITAIAVSALAVSYPSDSGDPVSFEAAHGRIAESLFHLAPNVIVVYVSWIGIFYPNKCCCRN